MKRAINYDVWVPLSILLGLTILFWSTDLDIAIQNLLYSPVEGWISICRGGWVDSVVLLCSE